MSTNEMQQKDCERLMQYQAEMVNICRDLGLEPNVGNVDPEYYGDMIVEAIMNLQAERDKLKEQTSALTHKGHVVLYEFDTYTLLFDPTAKVQPFIAAFGFDKHTGEWSQGHYFSDLGCAYDFANPKIIESATSKWCLEDIKSKLMDYGIIPSSYNIEITLKSRPGHKHLGSIIRDSATIDGYEVIDDRIMMFKDSGLYD